jgi:hypothetical protein
MKKKISRGVIQCWELLKHKKKLLLGSKFLHKIFCAIILELEFNIKNAVLGVSGFI